MVNIKEYWENYVDYWENKILEANSNKESHNKTVGDNLIIKYMEKLQLKKEDKLLDFGCGSCRLYPYYRELTGGEQYFGVDIAKRPLEHARESYNELRKDGILTETDGENIPFKNESFDNIVCFGVFDACNQEVVLAELLRVLKTGGKLLITGKNDTYYENDEEALLAEINARKKGHPNFFTDVTKMIEMLEEKQLDLKETYFFKRRGDMVSNIYVKDKPQIFYEWIFIIQKKCDQQYIFDKFSNEYSNTYLCNK